MISLVILRTVNRFLISTPSRLCLLIRTLANHFLIMKNWDASQRRMGKINFLCKVKVCFPRKTLRICDFPITFANQECLKPLEIWSFWAVKQIVDLESCTFIHWPFRVSLFMRLAIFYLICIFNRRHWLQSKERLRKNKCSLKLFAQKENRMILYSNHMVLFDDAFLPPDAIF